MALLNSIEEIDWKNLRHAYGEASDVPENLRALTSKDEETYEQALHSLFGSIWHQGTVYQATGYATPFLVELLASDAIVMNVRISIAHLLHSIANGYSYIDVHYPVSEDFYKVYSREEAHYEDELARELSNVRFARESVLAEKDSIIRLLDHGNSEFVCNIFMLLSGFDEYGSELFHLFVHRYQTETELEIRNSILEAIRAVKISDEQKVAFFKKVFAKEKNLELKAIAALSLVETQKRSYDSDAMELLLEFVKSEIEKNEDLNNLPSWKFLGDGTTDIRQIALAIIQLSTPKHLTEFSSFISMIDSPPKVFDFVQQLFFHLFPDDSHKDIFRLLSGKDGKHHIKYSRRGPVEIELSDPMIPVPAEYIPTLKMISNLNPFWEVESNLLKVFGLPHSRIEIGNLLRI